MASREGIRPSSNLRPRAGGVSVPPTAPRCLLRHTGPRAHPPSIARFVQNESEDGRLPQARLGLELGPPTVAPPPRTPGAVQNGCSWLSSRDAPKSRRKPWRETLCLLGPR